MSVVFQRSHFMASLERYRELGSLLANNAVYVAHLGIVCERKSAEEYAEMVMDVVTEEQRQLQVLARMIEEEIANTADEALGSVLRGNNALSKLEGEFVKRKGRAWLKDVLGPVMSGVLSDVACYEVDPSKVQVLLGPGAKTEEIESVCALGKESVLQLADSILAAVCCDHSLKTLPMSMRVIAAKTLHCAQQRGVEDALAVAGGFLWLRVLSPALTSPGSSGILGDSPPILHENQRRRVLLATKLVQGASNNVPFGKKEPHMLQFNDFIQRASGDVKQFLRRVCTLEVKLLHSLTTEQTNAPEMYASVESVDALDVNTLMSMHRLCAAHCDKLLAALSKKNAMGKSGTRLAKVLAQLGPAPPQESIETQADEPTSRTVDATLPEGDTAEKPIYWHDSTLFVVARRLRSDLISENCSLLIEMVLELMREGGCHLRPYDVVFDMTYFAPSTSLKVIFQVGSALYKSLPHDMRKNIRMGVVLHPDRVARSLVQFAQALTSEKARKKLKLCFSWNDLDRVVPGASAMLPEESKTHVLESLSVVKINKAGKRQHRLVKLTPRSLLNIDPKGPRVQNERAIGLIDKIVLMDERRVTIRFVEPDQAKARDWNEQTVEQFAEKLIQKPGSGGVFSRLASNVKKATVSDKDLLEREYEFMSEQQRGEFVLGILKLGLTIQKKIQNNPLPHFFVVFKTGSVGQSQIRIWLLTTDSILNLDTSLKMHSEIGFAAILSVKADPDRPDTVLLRVLDREETMAVRTEWRDSLVAAISDALPTAAYRQDDSRRIHSLMEEMSVRGGVSVSGSIPELRPRVPRLEKTSQRSRSANVLPEVGPRPPRPAAPTIAPVFCPPPSGGGEQLSPRGSPRGSPRIGSRSQQLGGSTGDVPTVARK